MTSKPKILIITPIKHIKGLYDKLSQISDIIYLPEAKEEDLNKHLSSINGIFTNPNKSNIFLGDNIFLKSPNLQLICTASTGTVHIDKIKAKEKNIDLISLSKEFNTINKITSTAELAFSLMLNAIRNIPASMEDTICGNWDYEKHIGRQLNNLHVGVLGYGRLGKMFSNYCKAFGSKVSIYDPFVEKIPFGLSKVDNIDILIKNCDVLSIHIHASEENINLLDEQLFSKMNENIIIINTSRGEIIDEDAAIKFLTSCPNAKIYVDVINNEINNKKNGTFIKNFREKKFNNRLCITPHIGGMTSDGQFIAYNRAADMLVKYFESNYEK
tara:strand:+ start:782 stop:1765 length:984 start_codon:yes stop_codon:yes gene_type:complete